MKFYFSLEKILKLKKHEREKEEGNFQKTSQKLLIEQGKKLELTNMLNELDLNYTNLYQKRFTAIDLLEHSQIIDKVEKDIKEQELIIKETEKILDITLFKLKDKKMEENIYTKLKDNKFVEFLLDDNRKEQKELDEIAIQKLSKEGAVWSR